MNQFNLVLLFMIALSVMMVSCSSEEENVNNEPPKEIDIAGNYIGQWSSEAANGSVYSSIPISANIIATGDPTNFSGNFYFTNTYTSCCNSGSSDGPITMKVVDKEIKTFEYIDILPGCNGNFKGSGMVTDLGRLRIEFTGSDCEGEHTNAFMLFTKQK